MPLSSLFASVRQLGRGRPQLVWRTAWRLAWASLLLAWSLLLLAWLTLHWFILPRLDDWRPELAAQVSRALGHPVQIGRVAVQSAGWIPAFTLHEVVILDAQGREALRLPKVSAALSVPSALALRLRFEQLLIEDARLEVRRDAQGRWSVGGLDLDLAGPALGGSAAADWLFEQHEFLIRGGTLRWVDEQRGAPPLQLSDVQLLLRNRGQRHELRLDATPPAHWGERFTLLGRARGALLSRAGDWTRWKGTLYADLPRADVSQLRRHVDLPVDLQQGEAALRAWVDWDRGQATAMTLDAALRGVSMRLAGGLAPVALADLGGRFVAERQSGGGRLAVLGLHFRTADGQAWAPSQLALSWRQLALPAAPGAASSQPATPMVSGEISADRLDLALMAGLGERLPIGAGLRSLLQQLDPEGTVQGLKARWEGPLDAPRSYSAQASIKGMAISAAPAPGHGGIGRPGWRGADLQIHATESGGRAELALVDGALDLPGVFEQPLVPLANFQAQLRWLIEPASTAADGTLPRVSLKLQNVRFDNADAKGHLSASWHTGVGNGFGKGGRLPGVLALEGQISEARALAVARYLPLGIGEDTRHWVQRAVQGGELRQVSYRVKGDLFDFPFINRRDGDFRIAGKVLDATLATVPSVPAGQREPAWESPWPAFSAVSGELVFDRNAMSFQQARGRLWGVELSEVQGRIRDLSEHAVLEVEGQARGPVADLLRYLRSTPLAEWTGHALDKANASGAMELRLALSIPLDHPEQTVLKAGLQLAGNDVRLRPDLPLLAGVRGRIEASTKSVQLAGVRAQLLGGETQIDGGSQADGGLRFVLNGNASAEGLRRLAGSGGTAQLVQRLQGQAAYRLQLGLPPGGALDWQLASNLQGLAINLPAPLAKPAETPLSLRLGSVPDSPAAAGRQARDQLRLELGALKAVALVEMTDGGPRPLRSALAWDAPLPEPLAGGRAVLALPRLDLDAWRKLLAGTSDAGSPQVDSADSPWLPRSIQLVTPELVADGRRLSGVTLELQRLSGGGDTGWHARVQADQTAGTVDYREPQARGGAGRIQARLSRLSLPPAEAQTVVDSMVGLLARAPASVPALDIEIEDFELRGRKLGQLAVEAVNRPLSAEPGARAEWRLNKLQLGNAEARLQASGRWRPSGEAARRMQLDFKLDIDDGGALLQRLGYGQLLRGTQGRISGTLGWAGSPLELDLPSLQGQLSLSLDKGQFLQVDPGAARLLGVLNLQALPRRFLLDFRDVFDQGFAFDKLTGDLRVSAGVAHTENLRLSSLQALVLMAGSADIGRETQDLQVVVVPELNTGSASLAYAAINPAVGLGAFLGQWLLREPLRMASAREFHVSGHWDEPKVERVDRKLLEPLPAAAAEAPPASAPLPRVRP